LDKRLRKAIMANYFWIAVGCALGGVARVWFSGLLARHFGDSFPLGTLFVNVSGSFIIGFFATFTGPEGRWLAPSSLRAFVMPGVLGGYTTFSSFSVQTLDLARNAQWFYAGLNAVLSLVLCLVAVWLGHLLALALTPTKGA
jgi:CrcB protein